MKQEYVGNDCITLGRWSQGTRKYFAITDIGSSTPREIPKTDCGKGECVAPPSDLIRIYSGINRAARSIINDSITRANRGQQVDFEHLLD